MLQSQINYWDLQETMRHNRATEEAGFQQARASEISANASRLQAEVAERTLPIKEREAQASLSQAEAALQNAETNRGNLDVNRMNAYTNRYNADINQQNANTNVRNASINQQNADTNRWNAAINEMNAVTNQRNAATNEWNARVNEYNAATNRIGTMSQVSLNETMGAKNIAESDLTTAKIPEQYQKNYQASILSKYAEAEQILGMIQSGTQSFSNVGSGLNSLTKSADNLVTTIANVTSSTNHKNSVHDTIRNTFLNVSGIKPLTNLANYAKDKNVQALEKFGLSVLGGIK